MASEEHKKLTSSTLGSPVKFMTGPGLAGTTAVTSWAFKRSGYNSMRLFAPITGPNSHAGRMELSGQCHP